MSDEWSDQVFEPSNFDGVELDILSTDDDLSNELIRHTYPFRDGASLQNAGAVPRTTACEIWFFARPELEDDHLERLRQFVKVAATTIPLTFLHPLYGSYQAMVESNTLQATSVDRDLVKVNCTFVEAGLNPAAFQAQTDDSVGSGVAGVELTAAAIDAITVDAAADPDATDLESITVQDTATTTAESWASNPTITQRQINLELNAVTNQIDDDIQRLGLATSVSNYPAWASMIQLHGSIRRAADLAIRTAPKLRVHIVKRTEPLLAIMADIYGGTDAIDRYTRTLELNNIRNPARVTAGTSLVVEL